MAKALRRLRDGNIQEYQEVKFQQGDIKQAIEETNIIEETDFNTHNNETEISHAHHTAKRDTENYISTSQQT